MAGSKTQRQDFTLGLTLILFLALFVGTIIFLYPRWGVRTRPLIVQFRHDQGVAPVQSGSPVLLSGALQVGRVNQVRTQSAQGDTLAAKAGELLIVVEAEIDQSLLLSDDCQITTDQPPVGGAGVLVITNVGTPGRPQPTGAIVGRAPQSFAATIGQLSRRLVGPDGLVDKLDRMVDATVEGSLMSRLLLSLADVNDMTRSLKLQLNAADQATLMAKTHRVIENLAEMTAALRAQTNVADQAALLAKLHVALDAVNDSLIETRDLLRENRPALTNTIAQVEKAATSANQAVVALAREFDRDDPRTLLSKLHAGMSQLNAALDDTAEIMENGRAMIVLSRPTLEATVLNLKEVSETLIIAGQQLMLQPWRLLKEPPANELKRLDVFDAARHFATAATRVNDASARLEAALAAAGTAGGGPGASIRPEELRAIQESLKGAFERFQLAEKFLYEKLK